jgi:hypothetical protein
LTLADASLEACTAPSACCDVPLEAPDSVIADALHGIGAAADGLQQLVHAVPERRDRGFDCRAAGLAPPSRVLFSSWRRSVMLEVGADPAAALQRPIDDGDESAAAGLDHVAGGLAGPDRVHERCPILLGIAGERPRRPGTPGSLRVQPGFTRSGLKTIHLQISLVAEGKPLVSIVEAEPLRHVLDRRGELLLLPAQAVNDDREDRGERDRAHDGGRLPAPILEKCEHVEPACRWPWSIPCFAYR